MDLASHSTTFVAISEGLFFSLALLCGMLDLSYPIRD